MSRTILTSLVALGSLFLVGCPSLVVPEAILSGFWTLIPADPGDVDDFEYEAQFDDQGELVKISGSRSDGAVVSLTIRNATSTLDGSALTIVIPTDSGSATFQGTLSTDMNSMEGSLTKEIDLGDLEAVLPGGDLTLERVAPLDPCDNITCDPGDSCDDGVCVPDDPCADVTCNPGESCDDGVCTPDDPCDDVTCDPGEICDDGVCVPDDACANVTCGVGEVCDNGNCVPEGSGPDPAAGETFFMANGCAVCHGPDGSSGFAESLVGVEAEHIFEHITGVEPHTGGTVDGATMEDAESIEAWIVSIQ